MLYVVTLTKSLTTTRATIRSGPISWLKCRGASRLKLPPGTRKHHQMCHQPIMGIMDWATCRSPYPLRVRVSHVHKKSMICHNYLAGSQSNWLRLRHRMIQTSQAYFHAPVSAIRTDDDPQAVGVGVFTRVCRKPNDPRGYRERPSSLSFQPFVSVRPIYNIAHVN